MSANKVGLDAEDIFESDMFIDKNYELKEISVGNLELRLHALHKASTTDHDLTGQIVWPAAKLLSLYLTLNPDVCRNANSIIELGSGAGLSGLVAAKLSRHPSKVLLTDYNDLVLELLQLNIDTNFQSTFEKPGCWELCWGITSVNELVDTYGGFDVILGADVVFWPQAVPLLFETVRSLLVKQPNAKFILSYINRANHSTELMFSEAKKQNLEWTSIDLSSEPYQQQLKEHLLSEGTAVILIFTLRSFTD